MPKKAEWFRKAKLYFIDDPIDSSSDEPDAPVRAPLKPKPNLCSGAVVLPELEPEESTRARGRSTLSICDCCALACEEAI